MRGPDEVYIALCRLSSQLLHLILCDLTFFALFIRYRSRIIVFPVAQVIRIALRTINEHVQLVVLHVFHQGKTVFHAVWEAIEAFHDTAVLCI